MEKQLSQVNSPLKVVFVSAAFGQREYTIVVKGSSRMSLSILNARPLTFPSCNSQASLERRRFNSYRSIAQCFDNGTGPQSIRLLSFQTFFNLK